MGTLRVMSWNVFWGLGGPTSKLNYYFRLRHWLRTKQDRAVIKKIIKIVNKYDPHVLALQEIDGGSKRNKFFDYPAEIAKETKLKNRIFADEIQNSYFNFGNALLSSMPLLHKHSKTYDDFTERRNYIRAEIPGGIRIITTHLDAHRFNEKKRLLQLEELKKNINPQQPTILLGDFNADLYSSEVAYIMKILQLEPLITEETYPTYNPKRVFDQIFVSKHFKVRYARVVYHELSDHYPVIAELSF